MFHTPTSTPEGVQILIPILLDRLTKQETPQSAVNQLEHFLTLYKDQVVSFFQTKLNHPQWKVRLSGVRLLESLLTGLPSTTAHQQRLNNATFPFLALVIGDSNSQVQEAVALLLEQLELDDLQPPIPYRSIPQLLPAIAIALDGSPAVSAAAAYLLCGKPRYYWE